jgi:hypothetical protein
MLDADEVLLVCGNGRCGTSLVMQMLEAAEVPTHGRFPAYETDRVGVGRNPVWISQQKGMAMKVLNPSFDKLHPAKYRIIWLHRDPEQQTISTAKFAHILMGVPPLSPDHRKRLKRSFERDAKLSLKMLRRHGEVLEVHFEDLITNPLVEAERIGEFVGSTRYGPMAMQVRPRGTDARPDIDLETKLIKLGRILS